MSLKRPRNFLACSRILLLLTFLTSCFVAAADRASSFRTPVRITVPVSMRRRFRRPAGGKAARRLWLAGATLWASGSGSAPSTARVPMYSFELAKICYKNRNQSCDKSEKHGSRSSSISSSSEQSSGSAQSLSESDAMKALTASASWTARHFRMRAAWTSGREGGQTGCPLRREFGLLAANS